MKIVFLILAHKNPSQLIKLVELLLDYQHATVIVHIDKKSDKMFREFKSFINGNQKIILLKKRYRVWWGSYNQIKATLSLIKAAASLKHDRCCLLSGQDLPLRPVLEMAEFFKSSAENEFLENFKLPDTQWEDGGLRRVQYFYFNIISPRISDKINTVCSVLQNLTGFKRPVMENLYGGSNWFNLTSKAMQYIVEYTDKNPLYLKRFRMTRSADEIFIQTLLLNSPFASSVTSDNLRFVDWSTGPEYPRTFRTEDLNRLLNIKEKFFARKFDENVDKDIVNNLYERFKG